MIVSRNFYPTEGSHSGRVRRLGKAVGSKGPRGFESLSFRFRSEQTLQNPSKEGFCYCMLSVAILDHIFYHRDNFTIFEIVSMPAIDVPPPSQFDLPEMHRSAPESPKPLGAKNKDGVYEVFVDSLAPETPEQREKRIYREERQLMDKATEVVLSYVIRQGLLVDKEPEELARDIRHSELFENEVHPLVKRACEGESGQDTTPTTLSPYVSVRTDKEGDVIETVHGFHIQPAVSLLNDTGEMKGLWGHDYVYDFQDRDTWQRIFPGTEPTLAAQEEADRILSEAEAAASDIQNEYKEKHTVAYTPELLAKADLVLKSLNIDADEYLSSLGEVSNLQDLLNPDDSLAPRLLTADSVREMALDTLKEKGTSPNDLQRYFTDFQRSVKAMETFKPFIENVPKENRGSRQFYTDFKNKFGEDGLRTLLRFQAGFHTGITDSDIRKGGGGMGRPGMSQFENIE